MKPRIVSKKQCPRCLDVKCRCKGDTKQAQQFLGMDISKMHPGNRRKGKILTLEEQERLQK